MFASLSKVGVAAIAAAAVLAPEMAAAQSYGYGSNSYYSGYDRTPTYYGECDRLRDNQVAGGVVGATIGAIAGSQIAARGRRTEGSVLGGVLGAAIGAGVGGSSNGSRGCVSTYDQSRYDSRYGYDYDRYNSANRYSSSSYGYDAYDRRYDQAYGYVRGYGDNGYANSGSSYGYQPGGYGDSCRLAESQVRLPDGRYETRYVRTCPDQYGRYRIVD